MNHTRYKTYNVYLNIHILFLKIVSLRILMVNQYYTCMYIYTHVHNIAALLCAPETVRENKITILVRISKRWWSALTIIGKKYYSKVRKKIKK